MVFKHGWKYVFCIVAFFTVSFYLQSKEGEGKEVSQIQQQVANDVENEINVYISEWVGRQMPELSLVDLDGNSVFVLDKEMPSVYIVWASWCSDCQRELPLVNILYNEFVGKVNFVTINLVGFRGETMEVAVDYYNENKFEFPIWFDVKSNVFNQLKIKAIPTLYFVNTKGEIKRVVVEQIEESVFRNHLQDLLL